ncbi:MAG: glycosyltransferase, partial [Cruoricaptor ignavus]|nr:glycosyltransferase [Cruoricaptor ignavus]
MRYKILFISSWFPTRLDSTNGNFVQRHAEAVAAFHDVEILHSIGDSGLQKTYEIDDKIINGVRTVVVYYKNTRFSFFNFFRRMKAYKKGFVLLQKPDLTHGNILKNNMFFALYLKLKYGIPFVISEHWSGFRRENHNFGFLEKYKVKFISRFASRIFPVSSDLKNGLNTLGISKPMQVIPNAVDLSLFYPSEKTNDRFT